MHRRLFSSDLLWLCCRGVFNIQQGGAATHLLAHSQKSCCSVLPFCSAMFLPLVHQMTFSEGMMLDVVIASVQIHSAPEQLCDCHRACCCFELGYKVIVAGVRLCSKHSTAEANTQKENRMRTSLQSITVLFLGSQGDRYSMQKQQALTKVTGHQLWFHSWGQVSSSGYTFHLETMYVT